ncbi:MAG: hypothetical protein FJX35_23290 [Alphaproteobacteria bacterium]|nr:hypothetical protein [Alphaproteobacteria bacterium]
MAWIRSSTCVLGAALLLTGCSFVSDALWPSMTGGDPARGGAQSPQPQRVAIAASPAEQAGAPPALGTTNFQPQPPTPAASTGTFVGQKLEQLRNDLRRLQGQIGQHNNDLQQSRNVTVQNAQRYHGTVAAINARLQVGTTPGNPVLVQQWTAAQTQLDQINNDIARMNNLANLTAADSAMASFLLESTRAAYGLSGAVDEDHRQLAILEDEVNRTVVLIDRLLNELSDDIARQSRYLAGERGNLTTLSLAIKNGQLYGTSLANRAYGLQPAAASPAALGSSSIAGRRPLVVIRFDRPNVSYEQALYTAVSSALERRPDATFDLVAVTPQAGRSQTGAVSSTAARRNAENVLRSLTDMGLPADRVNLSAMTSAQAQSTEVHLYVR